MSGIFVAVDFETADRFRDSACAVGMVRVESGKIVHKEHRLIKPPRKYFEFTFIHGITWDMVYSSRNGFRIKSEIKLSEYNCNQDLVSSKTENQIGFSIASEPGFQDLWPSLKNILTGIDFLAAHNSSFDRSVLHACCEKSNIKPPSIPFQCTVKLAREKWGIYPTKLPNVCSYLDIPLNHHEALSDAEACAKIVIAASEQ